MKKGFTLIELLIVVLVIAILVAIAVPLYMITIEKGKATEVVKLSRDIYNAVERYSFRNNGASPASFTDLDIELRGVVPDNAPLQFTNDYAQFTINADSVEGQRFPPSDSFGDYFFTVSRAAADEGVMYCSAAQDTDAVKVCAGLSTNDNYTESGGYRVYRM